MFPISRRHFAMPLVPLAIVIRAAYGRANFLVFEGVAKTHPSLRLYPAPGNAEEPQPVQHDDLRVG
jgi:hypothetical protein